jgi:hypothetical protein
VGQPSRLEGGTAGRKAAAPRGPVFGRERGPKPILPVPLGELLYRRSSRSSNAKTTCGQRGRNKRENIGINHQKRSLAFIQSDIKSVHSVVSNIHPSSSRIKHSSIQQSCQTFIQQLNCQHRQQRIDGTGGPGYDLFPNSLLPTHCPIPSPAQSVMANGHEVRDPD